MLSICWAYARIIPPNHRDYTPESQGLYPYGIRVKVYSAQAECMLTNHTPGIAEVKPFYHNGVKVYHSLAELRPEPVQPTCRVIY